MGDEKHSGGKLQRRTVLGGMCVAGLAAPVMANAQTQMPDQASLTPPQAGDVLVRAYGDDAGEVMSIDALMPEMKQIFVWAMDPATGVIRNGTRLNQVLLVRLEPERMSEQTAARSVNGLVAYSGVCSHTGCDVTDWNADFKRFQCPCHESQYDPADGARVVGGPAPWQLAALPLKDIGGKVGVAGEFEGRIGFQQPGLTQFGI